MMANGKTWLAGIFAGLAMAGAAVAGSSSSNFPQRPIEVVDPYPPGGSTETVARRLQAVIGSKLGEPMIVVAKPGAAGNIGAVYVARDRNPHKLLMAASPIMAINPHTYKNAGFDPFDDFVPISLLCSAALAIAVRSGSEIDSLDELVEYARANPGKLFYGTPGLGSPHHLTVAKLAEFAKIDIGSVHYNGIAPAIVDLIGGHVGFIISTYASLKSHVEAGKVKVLAIPEAERLAMLPDVPTVAEYFPGFEMNTWFGIFAPQGTTPDVAKKLENAFSQALQDQDVREAMESLALTIGDGSSDSLRSVLKRDYEMFGQQVKEMKISVQ